MKQKKAKVLQWVKNQAEFAHIDMETCQAEEERYEEALAHHKKTGHIPREMWEEWKEAMEW